MWRAFFLAIGVFTCLVGLQCLVIEEAVFANFAVPPAENDGFGLVPPPAGRHVVNPPDWAPWAFLASGVVVILYSFTIPRRMQS